MTGAEINGRPIDVHYSLPRDHDIQRGCDGDKNQGTLLISVENATQPVLVDAVRQVFAPFGDIKHITPSNKRSTDTYIEFWDSRAANRAFNALNRTRLAGGLMRLSWMWDMSPPLIQQSQRAMGNFYNAPVSSSPFLTLRETLTVFTNDSNLWISALNRPRKCKLCCQVSYLVVRHNRLDRRCREWVKGRRHRRT